MAALNAVSAQLAALPRPVLCLDTCDLLDIIQCLAEGAVARLEAVVRLLRELSSNPTRVQLVVSFLVPVEWGQNLPAVVEEGARYLRKVDEQVREVHAAWGHLGSPLPHPPPAYSGPQVTDRLQRLAELLLNHAVVLDRDDGSVERATNRVIHKRRPSHKGAVKDSIHLEHYLELTRQLRQVGFTEPCVFVSANKADFWEDRARANLHPELVADLGPPLNLEFFGGLGAALGRLGI
jgi:hypothetical protein